VLVALAVRARRRVRSPSAAARGTPARGKTLFVRPGVFCASCHILKAVHSTGRDGPNLDRAKPTYARIVAAVSTGTAPTRRWPTGMPRYAGRNAVLTKAEIQDVAAFVFAATHG
jgi:mono/diheme cytochrome c family protein